MKKMLFVLVGIVALLVCSVDVNAESPIKSVNFCGIVNITDVGSSVRVVKADNSCEIKVELNDPSYTIVSGTGNVNFQDGQNTHNIVIKDATGKEQTYPISVNFNSGYNSSNPSTGDNTIMLITAAIVCVGFIAISFNRINKYSKNITD